jgi:hypothetical protein
MPYRMTDDSVTKPGAGHPEYSGKTVTRQGNEMRQRKGIEPGRLGSGNGQSTARDVTSVRSRGQQPILPGKMPNLR